MKTEELRIEGMTCGQCVMSLKKALGKLAGVRVESAEIGEARVQYDESRISHLDLERAIGNAGYRVVNH